MTTRAVRRGAGALLGPTPPRRRRSAPDATTEPDPGPAPEAVFDAVTGPYQRRAILVRPGVGEHGGET